MAKQDYTIELEERQYKFLQEMVNKYALPDVGKAVRCMADYAVDNPERQDDLFMEIRCLDC